MRFGFPFHSVIQTGPREDFGHLPPAKRKKKLQGKVKELEDLVKKETAEQYVIGVHLGNYLHLCEGRCLPS